MKLIKVLLKNINVLNLLLLAMAIFLFLKLDDSLALIGKKVNFTIPKPKEVLTKNEEKAATESAANYSDYIVIAEKNLFHPQRRIALEIKEAEQMARPEIILYGTLITDEKRIAFIEDKKNPYSTPGRGKRQVTVDEGSMIAGYKLEKVNAESILLVHGDDRITVDLKTQKDRKYAEAAATSPSSGAVPDSISVQKTPSSLKTPDRSKPPYVPPMPPMRVRPTLYSR
jgi:hypothetical protein